MRNIKVVDYTYGRRSSDDIDTSLPFADNYKETKTIQQANVVIASYMNENTKDIAEINNNIDDLVLEVESKQDELISGENIKTINGESILGEGDISLVSDVSWGDITGDIDDQLDLKNALDDKQATLIGTETTGQNIKTINGNTILGTGDLTITAGSASWGDITGDIDDQTDLQTALSGKQDTLVSGTSIKTINNTSLLGNGDITVQETLVGSGVGQNIKTVNNNNLLGTGNISVLGITGWLSAGSSSLITYNNYDSTNKILTLSTNIDFRGYLSLGSKIKIEDNNINYYGIIVSITSSTFDIYIGNQTYSNVSLSPTFDYSYLELPQGFPQYMSSLDKLYLPIEIPVGIRNNKPYYRKCYKGTSTVSGDHNISISDISFDYIEIESFSIKSGSFSLNCFGYNSTNDQTLCFINTNTKNITWVTGTSWANATFNCVLEYTKTTD